MVQQYDGPRPIPAWYITRVEDTTSIVGVTPMAVKRVHLRLADGSDTFVDVPVNDYNAATVKRFADRLAENHFEVLAQRGPDITPPG
jgi:hypothetical protein